MKKRTIYHLILLLLLTGCTVNYDLEIENNNFYENITGNVLNSELSNDGRTDMNLYDYLINNDQQVFENNSNIVYNKALNSKENSKDFQYSYNFTEANFQNSRLLNSCFDKFSFSNDENKFYIHAYGKFKCLYTNKININIKTNNNVISHNASSVKKNTYSWVIDDKNVNEANIFIVINKQNNEKEIHLNLLKIIGFIIITILSIICIFIVKKKNSYE